VIRIERGDEPDALRSARQRRLSESPAFKGYGVARAPLHRAQHGKCAYCEMQQQDVALPTEHFRPKARVTDDPDHQTALTGYWWLAWTWGNLLFSCATCNSPARKGNHFALERGSIPLQAGQEPPCDERPMFVDPSREDPLEHISFVQLRPGRWVPRARRGSERGEYTIIKLGLDRPELLTLYDRHVRHTVQPLLQQIRAVLKLGDSRDVSKTWSCCLRRLFCPEAPFHALSYDVLEDGISATERGRWRLELPRPGPR
jgi:uncharacterized protein (TIGR02646 family)